MAGFQAGGGLGAPIAQILEYCACSTGFQDKLLFRSQSAENPKP